MDQAYNDADFLTSSPHQPYDSFDFQQPHPHTPSYNGSYQGSPYSVHSDLSFEETDFRLFDESKIDSLIQDPSGYDPREYDAPDSGNSLLMFSPEFSPAGPGMGGGYDVDEEVSISVAPAPPDDLDHRSPFDYSSPSIDGDSGAENDPMSVGHEQSRSRASSVASSQHSHHSGHNLPQGSPHLGAQFENLNFDSPSWANAQLPSLHGPDSPSQPRSPPLLHIPPSQGNPAPPMINAPDGDGTGMLGSGPSLNIVPATPVSGGGIASTGANLFQSTLRQSSSNWNGSNLAPQSQSYSPNSSPQIPSPNLNISSNQQPSSDFLGFNPNRSRSRSEASLQPWDPSSFNPGGLGLGGNALSIDDSGIGAASGTVNMGDVEPSSSSRPPQPHLTHHYTFGPPGTSSTHPYTQNPAPPQLIHSQSAGTNGMGRMDVGQFLSPDMGANMRRARSTGHSRQSRSEDFGGMDGMMGAGGGGGYQNLFPPSSQQEFIRQQQFLTPFGVSNSSGGGAPAQRETASFGHHRRASSGSRVRGVGGESAEFEFGGGDFSGPSSVRASPYPSPNASPRLRQYEELQPSMPNLSMSGRGGSMGMNMIMGGGMGMGGMGMSQQHQMSQSHISGGQGGAAIQVAKPNVTTGRTANASLKRRKQEATFKCTVPGCGSTFTRSFNLKGHLRSHNEEKPFQCPWPGCGKGFARQHDCKRHEQLHSNYRPHTCTGCKKPFARMDALNRHLKSEGGIECRKLMDATGLDAASFASTNLVKSDSDGSWSGGSSHGLVL